MTVKESMIDQKKVNAVYAVYSAMFDRTASWDIAVELTKIYFDIPVPEFRIAPHDEVVELSMAHRHNQQSDVIDSLSKQIVELKSRLERTQDEAERSSIVADMRSYQSFEDYRAQMSDYAATEFSNEELKKLWDDTRW